MAASKSSANWKMCRVKVQCIQLSTSNRSAPRVQSLENMSTTWHMTELNGAGVTFACDIKFTPLENTHVPTLRFVLYSFYLAGTPSTLQRLLSNSRQVIRSWSTENQWTVSLPQAQGGWNPEWGLYKELMCWYGVIGFHLSGLIRVQFYWSPSSQTVSILWRA